MCSRECVCAVFVYECCVCVYVCGRGPVVGGGGAYHPHIQVPPPRRPLTRFYETLPCRPNLPHSHWGVGGGGGAKITLRNVNKRPSKRNTFYGRAGASIFKCPASPLQNIGERVGFKGSLDNALLFRLFFDYSVYFPEQLMDS